MNGGFTMIGVPVDSAGQPGGTELAPAALRALGLGAVIAGRDEGDLAVRIRAEGRDPATGVVALEDVCSTTSEVRRAVAETLSRGERPFLIGGCCAIVPGALAGVRDVRGGVSLAHLDGHLDLYDETTSQLGEAADMPVAVAVGLGPRAWVDAAGGPSLSSSDVWIVGYRDREQSLADGMLMPEDLSPPISCLTTDEIRSEGPDRAGARVAGDLASGSGNTWVHLDLDIVDPALFFANDAPVPEGLNWEELTELLAAICASPALAGVSLGCYNPEKDRNQENGRQIVKMFSETLSIVG
ncbi:MAG TPA: arginase family protein [Acidimicrobiia bacterium]|nr:arginase family protein [Acidimicrobiia bacterium]